MKSREFYVPVESMVDFTTTIEENELNNRIIGLSEDEEIIVLVSYEPQEREAVMDLSELLETTEED